MLPVYFAVSEALIEGEQLVDSEDDSVYICWSVEFWIFSRVANLHVILEVKKKQSLCLRIEEEIACCNISMHNIVSEVDLVDDLSHLN